MPALGLEERMPIEQEGHLWGIVVEADTRIGHAPSNCCDSVAAYKFGARGVCFGVKSVLLG